MSALASVNQRIQDWSAGPYDRLQPAWGLSSRDRRMPASSPSFLRSLWR